MPSICAGVGISPIHPVMPVVQSLVTAPVYPRLPLIVVFPDVLVVVRYDFGEGVLPGVATSTYRTRGAGSLYSGVPVPVVVVVY